MPTLFLAYANSESDPLAALRDEDDKVNAALSDRASRGDYRIVREQYATRENLTAQLPLYQQDMYLFLFSGHAGRDELLLSDGIARAEGIAQILRGCPNLTLVLLNGCSTAGQVDTLLETGVPMVIATSSPIGDITAKHFAIQFCTELAKNRNSVRQSFEAALAAAKIFGRADGKIESRAIGRIGSTPGEPLWGLYYRNDQADLLDTWRLPMKMSDTKANVYLENAINAIFEEHLKAKNEDSRSQDLVLKRLPYTISEPIRKLLAPRDASGQVFYDTPSPERYAMLLYAYRSVVNFLTFVLLSQLWREKLAKNNVNTEGVSQQLRTWLLTDFRQADNHSLLPILAELMIVFKEKPLYFEELNAVWTEMTTGDTRESVQYLEQQIADNPKSNLEFLCDNTEQNLALVLYTCGFLVNYALISVKDIAVLFYMHNQEPEYDHKIVRLQQQITALEDRNEVEKKYYKTASVLLRHVDDKNHALYLSPFLIDENAYTKTPKANLRYFVAYDKTNRYFHFKNVSKPEDILRIEKKRVNPMAKIKGLATDDTDYFSLINGQFAAFCEAVLGTNLDSL